jgi:hypothetical protein
VIEKMLCEQQIELLANYSAAATAYCASVARLEQALIGRSAEIYAERRRASEEARIACDAARQELEHHETAHQCHQLRCGQPPKAPASKGGPDSTVRARE